MYSPTQFNCIRFSTIDEYFVMVHLKSKHKLAHDRIQLQWICKSVWYYLYKFIHIFNNNGLSKQICTHAARTRRYLNV